MRFTKHLVAGSLVLLTIFSTRAALGQATRTWVSGVGDDANPCSRTAPCKTFAGAISKTAPAGEIDVLDPGGFGAVTITKSISIEADGVIAGVLVSGTNGIVVSAGASDVVVIRGLTIDGLGTGLAGIKFLAGKALYVEDCTINNFTGASIDFEPSAADSFLSVKNTVARNSTGGGILVKGINGGSPVASSASLENVRMERNLFGIRVEALGKVGAHSSVAAGNTNNGFLVVGPSNIAELNLDHCAAVGNGGTNFSGGGAVSFGAQATLRISNTLVSGNSNGVFPTSGGSLLSYRNNSIAGNLVDGTPTGFITPN
jgi:parallel beta helix pectate lyase-like protein